MCGNPNVPRKVATISEYVAANGCEPRWPASTNGDTHDLPSRMGNPGAWGVAAPAGNTSTAPSLISYFPALKVSGPSIFTPSIVPWAVIVTGVITLMSTEVCTCTVVAVANTGGTALVSAWRCTPPTTASRTTAGTAIATNLIQYCSAWTKVTPFMPPAAMLLVTTIASTPTPTQ